MAGLWEVGFGTITETVSGEMEVLFPRLHSGEIYTQTRVGGEVVERPLREVVQEVAASVPEFVAEVVPDRDAELLHYATPEERRRIEALEGHVLDVRDGRPANGAPPSPYDTASTTETQRAAAKTAELGLKRGEMRRIMGRYQDRGRAGFLHGNRKLPGDVLRRVDSQVLAVVRAFVEREKVTSKKHLDNQHAMVLAELRQRGLAWSDVNQTSADGSRLPEAIELLPDKRFKAVVRALRDGDNPKNDAKTTQSKNKRPKNGPVKDRAADFGDLVEIDSTPCDFQVWGPDGPQKVHAVLAVDVATRYAWIRLTLGAPTGIDLAVLVHDMINPQPLGSLAPIDALPNVPKAIRFNAWPPHAGDAPPPLLPGCVVLDHGTEGENTHFIGLLAQLGTAINWARTMTPTDKAHIESLISKFAAMCQVIPGHKGNAVKNRPERLQTGGLPTFRTVAAMFRLWTFYAAAQPHTGLPHGLAAKRFQSPNEAVLSSLARRTKLRVAGDVNLPMRFLPSFARVPADDGVSHGPTYWCEGYNDLIRCASSAGGARQKLVFHHHPDDDSRIFWNEPGTHRWRTLYAAGGDGLNVRPFEDITEEMLREIPGRKRKTKTQTAVEKSYLYEEFSRILTVDEMLPPPITSKPPKPRPGLDAFEVTSGGWDLDDLQALSISSTDWESDGDDEPW